MIYLDNKICDNLKYLDKILTLNLELATNYKIDAKKLAENINPMDFSSLFSETWSEKLKSYFIKPKSFCENLGDNNLEFNLPLEFNSEESKFINALYFLHSEQLVVFQSYPINTITLTFKGMIKISNGGFYKEYKRQIWKDRYQKYSWIIAIITFIAGWILKPIMEIIIKYFN
jgi:hypothetical protein